MNNFPSSYIEKFNLLSSNRKFLIVAILILFLLVGILLPTIISNSVQPQSPPITQAIPSPSVSQTVPATLKLTSDKPSYKVGDTITVSLDLDSGTYGVGAADFVVHFDPEVIQPTLITPGNYFKVIANKSIENDFVKISGIAEVTDKGVNFPSGKGQVATIQFQALSEAAQTAITFDTEKTIVASNGENILNQTQDLTISVTQ